MIEHILGAMIVAYGLSWCSYILFTAVTSSDPVVKLYIAFTSVTSRTSPIYIYLICDDCLYKI